MGRERGQEAPADSVILAQVHEVTSHLHGIEGFDQLIAESPKETFEALVRLVRLRRSPALYERIGSQVSLAAMKKDATALRIAAQISEWFPPKDSE